MLGQGADEIFSDYALYGSTTLGGDYTGVRSKWDNFDAGYNRNIIGQSERALGAIGVEARYPFLDRNVVQEFLWLEDEVKNSEYKQCLAQRLRKHNMPFVEREKFGFRSFDGKDGPRQYTDRTEPILEKTGMNKPEWINSPLVRKEFTDRVDVNKSNYTKGYNSED